MKVWGGPLGARGHRGDDRRGVHAAAEQGAVGDVGHHLALHRGGELARQRAREVLLGQLRARRLAEAADLGPAVRRGGQQLAGGQLAHAREQGPGPGHEAAGEVVVQRHRVELRPDEAGVDEGADLGGDRRAPAVGPPVQGLDAEGVAGGHEALLAAVPDGQAVHAVDVPEEVLGAGLLVAVHDRLAVRVGREAVAGVLEALAQVEVVVDLAVGHQGDLAVFGEEGLIAALDVDDRQAGAHQGRGAEALHRAAVGPAVAHGVGHPLTGVGGRGPGRVEQRCDAAHAATSSQ